MVYKLVFPATLPFPHSAPKVGYCVPSGHNFMSRRVFPELELRGRAMSAFWREASGGTRIKTQEHHGQIE